VRETAKIRVRVQAPDADNPGYHVHLPTYMMVPGSEEYADPEKKVLKSVEVEVPDDYVDEKGQLSKEKIRAKYKGQPRWDRDDVLNDI